jgi:hypothetical protein
MNSHAANTSKLHITFGIRGDGSLQAALKQAGRPERVVPLWDDLSLGPIDPPDLADRWAWAKRELGLFPYSRKLFTKKNNAWDIALSAGNRKIAWVARRWSHEYCGFLEWLWRLGDEACDVVDLHDVTVDRHHRDGTVERYSVPWLAGLFAEEIHDNALWDLARPLSPERRRHYHDVWRKLRAENAAFRVWKDEELISAPITHYDDIILGHARADLRKVAWVIRRPEEPAPAYEACEYIFHGRLHKLVEAGLLEAWGDIAKPGYSEVRRVPKAETAKPR